MADDLARAVDRLAAAIEKLVAVTQGDAGPPADEPCTRCKGRARWAPGVPCDACAGTGRQPIGGA